MLPKTNSQTNPHSYPRVSRRNTLYIAWNNLRVKKLRSSLTVAGVVVGIGSIFFLLSFGLGLQNLVTNEIIGNQSVKTIDVVSPNSSVVKLNQANYDKIANLPKVADSSGIITGSGTIQSAGSEIDSVVYGTDQSYRQLANLNLIKGKYFTDKDKDKAVISSSGLEALGLKNDGSAIGQKINLKLQIENDDQTKALDNQFEIIGIVKSDSGSEVFLPTYVFSGQGVTDFTQVKLVAASVGDVVPLQDQIQSLGLATSTPLDTIRQVRDLFKYVNLILAGFGSIGMIVAILGMFNTLTISLLERTREIGLMITLGIRNKDIKRLFIYESVLLSLIGSVIGIVMASLTGGLLNVLMNGIASRRGFTDHFSVFAVPWWLPVTAILFMVTVGLGVSYFPARRAGSINPIDALRDE